MGDYSACHSWYYNKKDGSSVFVSIGDDLTDPIVGISDLLIHLAADQLQKTATKVIEGEDLDITFGSIPLKAAEKDAVKANVLKMLKEKYDIEEEDFYLQNLRLYQLVWQETMD